jgi:hypothetical protein
MWYLKMAVSWVAAPCSPVEIYRRFRDACCFIVLSIALMMEAASTSETLVNFRQITRRNLGDSHLHTRCRENLKSHLIPDSSPTHKPAG